jgi:spore coat polysaccharide biosynthesis predicted glycosyltransferase SpsG
MTSPARPAVVFLADASHELGFGHIARLSSVIEEVEPAGAEPIAMFGGDDAVAAWTRRQGIAAQVQAWTADERLAAAGQERVRAVVIDGPALARALIPALAARDIRTVLIDDGGDVALPVDAVINHNFHAPALGDGYPAAGRRLLGRRYLMLRRAVRRYPRGACHPAARERLRVIVTFGGSDPVGATARTLRIVPGDRPADLVVVAGPGFRDLAALDHAAARATAAGHTVELVRDAEDLGGLFAGADAAICSAGGTLGELAYLGCPALAYAIVPDQLAGARAQVRAGLIAGGRAWSQLTDEALRAELLAFLAGDDQRRDQRARALATADGGGPGRIVAEALS